MADKIDYSIRLNGVPDGLKELQKKFQKMNPTYAKAWRVALNRAGLFIKREAQLRTPVDTGALKNSARYRTMGTGWKSFGVVSYHTAYAVAVHENVRQSGKGKPRQGINKKGKPRKGTYWDNGQPKFLENAYRENRKEMLHRIRMDLQRYSS